MNTTEHVETLLSKVKRLPALPQNVEKINQLIDAGNSTMDSIGREIARDQALSAQVLRLINSSFYGFSSNVSSIPHAAVLLGLNTIKSVINTSWISDMISKSFPGLYDHSMACARACYLISKHFGVDEPEQMNGIGLLHDVGKVILAEHLPEEFDKITALVRTERLRFHEAERTVLGVTHADIGCCLLKKWNVPSNVEGPIGMHHSLNASDENATRAAILVLGDLIVRAEGFGWCGDDIVAEFPEELPSLLNFEVSDLKPLMDEIADHLHDIPRHSGDRGQ